jgi:hypothetical protein
VKKKSGLSYTCSFDTALLETAAGCTAAVSAVKQTKNCMKKSTKC